MLLSHCAVQSAPTGFGSSAAGEAAAGGVEDEDEASSAAYTVATRSAGDSRERNLILQSIEFLCVGVKRCRAIRICGSGSFSVLTVCKCHVVPRCHPKLYIHDSIFLRSVLFIPREIP